MTLLSHYTSRAGLEGMARTKTFWGTRFLDLNDSSEFTYGWEEIYKSAIEAFRNLPLYPVQKLECNIEELSKSATKVFKKSLSSTDGYGQLYVTSFAQAK